MTRRHQTGRPALDLLEEAVHLLRTSPGAIWAWYYLGALPFVLMLLYFWTDMSWSADAPEDCAVGAMETALAFVWMKFCQSMFARRLRRRLNLELPKGTTLQEMFRVFLQQTIIQPSKLFLLPAALVATIPFGWVCAFYENVTAFGSDKNVRALWSKSWRQATLWPRQNHLALGLFLLFRLVMAANILLLVLLVPHLLKMFTGFENIFTRSGISVMNSTSLAVVCAGTYLCCDPLLKALYVLRGFYGESLESGEDLQVELRRMRQASVAIVAIALLFSAAALPIFAATPGSSAPLSVDAQELDRSIKETLSHPEFRWRMPREETESTSGKSASSNFVERFFRSVFHTLGKWWRSFTQWLDRLMPKTPMPSPTSSDSAGSMSRLALEICLIVLGLGLLALLGWKIQDYFVGRRASPQTLPKSEGIDLKDENVTADQLPENEWLELARGFVAKGELRLALRALFLAGIAHLAQRELIVLARHKSNQDYQIELRRRAPAQMPLHEAFAQVRRAVERAWYGRHDVNSEILEEFQENLDQIRAA
jgi:hypothetical protein